jgi:hypothetical protein
MPCKALEEPHDPSRRHVAVRVEDDRDDQHHQEMDDQRAEAAHVLPEPPEQPPGIGLDAGRERAGVGLGELRPRPVEPGAEREGCDPRRRWRELERGQRADQRHQPVRLLDDRVHRQVDRHHDDGEEEDSGDGDRGPATIPEPLLRRRNRGQVATTRVTDQMPGRRTG